MIAQREAPEINDWLLEYGSEFRYRVFNENPVQCTVVTGFRSGVPKFYISMKWTKPKRWLDLAQSQKYVDSVKYRTH